MTTILEKLNKTAQDVKVTSEISKLNSSIQKLEKEKENLFLRLGKNFYDMSIKGSITINDEQSVLLFDTLREFDEEIVNLKTEINRIMNIKRCYNCGNECSNDSVFVLIAELKYQQKKKILMISTVLNAV